MSQEKISDETISKLYDEADLCFHEIQNSNLEANSNEYQDKILMCITRYEHLTVLISQVNLFSTNEIIEELPTSSIRFLLLPAKLGFLTLQRQNLNESGPSTTAHVIKPDIREVRKRVVNMAKIYYEDFLKRCRDYEITSYQPPSESPSVASPPASGRPQPPTPEQLKQMNREREDKIKRYKEQQELKIKIKEVKEKLAQLDEDLVRQFYLDLVTLSVHESIDELSNIRMELKMLEFAPTLEKSPTQGPKKPLETFLITRDAAQKAVYGMGYPSLPIMSVEEFYEKRVRDGWFPAPVEPKKCLDTKCTDSHISQKTIAEGPMENEGEEPEKSRESLQARDEYRDMHRTGWGNTYNRS